MICLRACQERDLQAVAELLNELKDVASTDNDFNLENLKMLFEEMEKEPQIYSNFVAEFEGIIAGFISVIFYKTLFHNGGTALINELIINSNFRRLGIGSLLVKRVKEEAIKRGMDELEVGTEITNGAAQQFYKKCGFNDEYVLLGMEFDA